MLPLYIGSFLFGGVLLGASLVGGHGGDGGHTHGDDGTGPMVHRGPDHQHVGRLPIFSLGFWAFTTAFFGLAGAALTLIGSGLGALVPVVAAAFGLGSGLISSRVLGRLSGTAVGLLGDAASHVGREGRVLLPVGPGRRGKIRLSIAGVSTDLVAETDADVLLQPGDTALVVGLRDNVAIVESNPAAPRLTGVTDLEKPEQT